jgi:hypothetical protein
MTVPRPKPEWFIAAGCFLAAAVLAVAFWWMAHTSTQERHDSSKTVADLIARSNRLQTRIDEINATNVISTCRTDLSAAAQSQALRGNADVLNGLAKVAENTLGPGDVAALLSRAKQQLAEADRRDRTLALCPPPITP